MNHRYRKKLTKWSSKGIILWILPLPLIPAFLLSLLRGDLARSVSSLVAVCLFMLGALGIRKGLKSEQRYDDHKVVKAPRVPRKFLGAVEVTFATFICSIFSVGHSLSFSFFIAILSFIGCFLAYGFDPRKDKVGNIIDSFDYSAEEVLDVMQKAEKKIAAIEQSTIHFTNRELVSRLENIIGLARKIVTGLEDDPRDLRKVRKFINVYLDGAEQVTVGYAKTMKTDGSGELEGRFRELLITIEEVFQQQQQKLNDNDILDLDVKIEVLMKRLHHEGV